MEDAMPLLRDTPEVYLFDPAAMLNQQFLEELLHFSPSPRKTDLGTQYDFACNCDSDSIGPEDDGWNLQEILSVGSVH
jgi:hypothetical protein